MDNDPRLGSSPSGGPRAAPLLARVFAFAAGAVVLVAALFFSVIVFAVLLVVGLVAGAWLWWQTREVRGVMREQMEQARRAQREQSRPAPGAQPGSESGEVIEGDFIREIDEEDPPDPGSDASKRR